MEENSCTSSGEESLVSIYSEVRVYRNNVKGEKYETLTLGPEEKGVAFLFADVHHITGRNQHLDHIN